MLGNIKPKATYVCVGKLADFFPSDEIMNVELITKTSAIQSDSSSGDGRQEQYLMRKSYTFDTADQTTTTRIRCLRSAYEVLSKLQHPNLV